jgi:hypothetical protein
LGCAANIHQQSMAIWRKWAHSAAERGACVRAEPRGETDMAKGEQRSNREAKKPKKEKIKIIAAAPSQKTGGWQPTLGTGKKK